MSKLILNTIKGSVNVVTGCGTGLGKATLQRLLRNGSGPLLGIDQHYDPDYMDSLELTHQQRELLTLETHNTFSEEVGTSLEKFHSKNGPIDNLINVAGVSLGFMFLGKGLSPYLLENSQALIEFNTVGNFNMIRLAVKYMIQDSQKGEKNQRTRCIINTSCISSTTPSVSQSMTASSKAAIDSMTLCLARELSPHQIRCNTINVGFFDTKLCRSINDLVINYITQDLLLAPNRLGQPDEFAQLVETMIENQFINGACIRLDAGAREVPLLS